VTVMHPSFLPCRAYCSFLRSAALFYHFRPFFFPFSSFFFFLSPFFSFSPFPFFGGTISSPFPLSFFWK
jgi:hypothetical protein